jgi:NAD kinase
MVLKKRGAELASEFVQVVRFLGETERMRVVVEPAEYDALVLAASLGSGGASSSSSSSSSSSGGQNNGAAAADDASTPSSSSSSSDNPLAASTRYLYTFTPQERERGGLAEAVDFVVCLGGDGVILHAGGLFGRSIPPVVSFHLGSMGFLTNHAFADFRSHLRDVIYGSERLEACDPSAAGAGAGDAGAPAPAALAAPVVMDDGRAAGGTAAAASSAPPPPASLVGSVGSLASGDYTNHARHDPDYLPPPRPPPSPPSPGAQKLGVMVTLRMRLECSVIRRGSSGGAPPEQVYEVLNEVVVDRGADSFLTNLECFAAGRLITRVQADGVMLATPTGSTAYSAAAGGSMVHPNVPGILLTPVCPHSLNFRPVVLPDYVDIELRVPDAARCGAWVCFDGKHRQQLGRGDRVRVRMSPNPMPTINKADLTGDWFESLERCFRWSNRAEQKPLPRLAAAAGLDEEAEEDEGGAVEGARAGLAAEADSHSAASRDEGDSAHARAERAARRAAEAEAMARAFLAAAGAGDAAAAAAAQQQQQQQQQERARLLTL